MDHAINLVIFAILALATLVMNIIGYADHFLSSAMDAAHVPPNAQIILLTIAAVALVVLAIRLLGRVFAALIIVLLLLILVRHTFPKFELPQTHLPPALNLPTTGNTTI